MPQSTVSVLNPALRPWEHRKPEKLKKQESGCHRSFPLVTVLFSVYQCLYYVFVIYRQRYSLIPSEESMISLGAKEQNSMETQPFRYFVAYFVPCNFIHFVLTLMTQMFAGVQLEVTSWGSIRVFLIIWIGEVSGMLASCTLSPGVVTTGSSSAATSLLGAYIVDIFNQWQVYPKFTWRRYATFWLVLVIVNFSMTAIEFNDPAAAASALIVGVATSLALLPVPAGSFRTALRTFAQIVFCGVVVVLLTVAFKPC